MRGQLSAEMLILITVVLAIVAIAASQLLTTAEETATGINKSSQTLSGMVTVCDETEDCPAGYSCNVDEHECVKD